MDGDLRNMVMSFRVTELQTLLGFAGKCKTGRKNELQARALEVVKAKNHTMVGKIKELYRSMQQTMTSNPAAVSSYGSNSNGQTSQNNQSRLYNMQSSGYSGAQEKVLQGISPFLSFNNQIMKPQTINAMPICPDVKMKRLPFYDIMSELIKPTSLIPSGIGRLQEITSSFCLTPIQAADIASSKEFVASAMGEQKLQYAVQCQLRFCALDSSVDQDDQFPPSICVKVNGKATPLPHLIPSNRPGVEAKRPSKPLNITNFVKLSPTQTNSVTVTWAPDSSKGYAMSVYLVRKLTSTDLLQRLKSKGPRPADYSRGLIKELTSKDDGDCMIAMTSLKVTIACPLGKCRMTLPCRATTCKHLQCFDANLFLQMNERKPTWVCPVCDKATLFDDLCIDGYFQEVIKKMPAGESMDVELMPDGSWHPLIPVTKKEKEDRSPPAKRMKTDTPKNKLDQTIDLDDDILIEDDPEPTSSKAAVKTYDSDQDSNTNAKMEQPSTSAKKPSGQPDVIDLTLSDSDDDSDDVPVTRPRRNVASKPKYNVDEDSSDSSTTTEGSAQTCRASPVAPMSPACITLDSRSPSPADRTSNSNNGNGRSDNLSSHNPSGNAGDDTGFSSSGSTRETRSSSAYGGVALPSSRSSSTTTYDYGHGHSYSQPTGYQVNRNNSSQPPALAPNVLFGQNFSPYSWDATTSAGSYNQNQPYPSSVDYGQIDFSTMDQYRFDSPTTRNNNYQGGYGGRWP